MQPHVILDTDYEGGLLWLALHNIGTGTAHKISVEFSRSLKGLNGRVDVTKLPLFRDLGMLPPGKRLRIVLDRADSFLRGRRQHVFSATVTFHDDNGKRRTTKARHNLDVYRTFPTTSSHTH